MISNGTPLTESSVDSALITFAQAKLEVTQAFLNALEREAQRREVTRMVINYGSKSFLKGDIPVSSSRLEKLLETFSQQVHPDGFYGVWEEGKGWSL